MPEKRIFKISDFLELKKCRLLSTIFNKHFYHSQCIFCVELLLVVVCMIYSFFEF